LSSGIDPTLEKTSHKALGQQIDDILAYVENKNQSVLYKMYNEEELAIYLGKKNHKTYWYPHPQKGTHVSGIKHWNAVEYFMWTEWNVVLSPQQQSWVGAWGDTRVDEFYVTGGRDSGKSFLGALLALYSMVFHNEIYPNFLVQLFAGAKEQAETVYEQHVIPNLVHSRKIHTLLSRYDPIWEKVSERKRQAVKITEMKLQNGAKMRINPTSTKAARSKHPDVLWFDEAVEAEDVRRGQVITSAVSSLTAGHMMRTLATSTVHKNPLGWFASQVRRAMHQMQLGYKNIYTVNLSEAGVDSKPWLSKQEQLKELNRKLQDESINTDAEFYGLIAGGEGDVFNQAALKRMLLKVSKPQFNKDERLIFSHDPGYGTSLYGFEVWQVGDLDMTLLDGEFWKKGDPSEIVERIMEYIKKYGDGEHACDAAATTTIKYLQKENLSVQSYQLGARPPGWDKMLEDEQQRYNIDSKTIGNNLINERLSLGRLWIHPKTGMAKPLTLMKDDPPIHPGRLLIEQMQTQRISETTRKPEKGNDDMIDSCTIAMLQAEFGQAMGDWSRAGSW